MFCLLKNNYKIIVKFKWISQVDSASSTAGLWQSPDGSSGDKASEIFFPFQIIRLKYKKPSKLIYSECKFNINMF